MSTAARVVEVVLPRRLGTGFRWLIAASWASNLGDGLALAAGPLLVASLTHDPLPVALAALASWLPPLLFGLSAGVLSDRVDRRLIVLVVDLVRAVLLGGLAAFVLAGAATVPLVLAALFLLATAEVFADNTASTLTPMLVARADLAVANARLQTGFVTVNQLAGPPLGAVLFTAGAASPFAAQAGLCALAAVLVSRLRLPARQGERRSSTPGTTCSRGSAGRRTTRPCASSSRRSSSSTSRSVRPGRSSSSTRRSASAWARWGSAS